MENKDISEKMNWGKGDGKLVLKLRHLKNAALLRIPIIIHSPLNLGF